MKSDFKLAEQLVKHAHLLEIPGHLLMKHGRQDYVGAVLCLRGTLYFKQAHTIIVREAICQCFDAFRKYAELHVSWLWREGVASGESLTPYANSVSLREMMSVMDEDDHLSFYYTSGVKEVDAGSWLFKIFGKRGWQAKMGDDLSVLEFSVPLLFQEYHPLVFLDLFLSFGRRLAPEHGHAGHAYNLSQRAATPINPPKRSWPNVCRGWTPARPLC